LTRAEGSWDAMLAVSASTAALMLIGGLVARTEARRGRSRTHAICCQKRDCPATSRTRATHHHLAANKGAAVDFRLQRRDS
jgi:hypothetical protein